MLQQWNDPKLGVPNPMCSLAGGREVRQVFLLIHYCYPSFCSFFNLFFQIPAPCQVMP